MAFILLPTLKGRILAVVFALFACAQLPVQHIVAADTATTATANTSNTNPEPKFFTRLLHLALACSLVGGFAYFFRTFVINRFNNGGSSFQLGLGTNITDPTSSYFLSKPQGKFADTIFGEQSEKLNQILCSIQQPEFFACVNAQPPQAILFYGPPGTGKTKRASAIAAELNAHFIETYGSNLFQVWIGTANRNIKAIFKKARELVQAEKIKRENKGTNKIHCVVFIDEVEAAAKDRSIGNESHSDNPLNALLTEIGSDKNDGILVIVATNCRKMLDKAFLRRFPDQIKIGRPTAKSLEAIFSQCVKNEKYVLANSFNIDWQDLAQKKFTGDDIKKLIKLAARNAGYRLAQQQQPLADIGDANKVITQQDINRALTQLKKQKIKELAKIAVGKDESDDERDDSKDEKSDS